jgi:mono/diheme cytochrome c family protein
MGAAFIVLGPSCAPPNPLSFDSDRDGVPDSLDAFPTDPTEQLDTDSDRVGDNKDAFPEDPDEDTDTDQDGRGNNADTDDDGDGIRDEEDEDPLDADVPNMTTGNPDSDQGEDQPGDTGDSGDTGNADDRDVVMPPDNPLANAPGEPVPGLSTDDLASFDAGGTAFTREFTEEEGLGSEAFAASCAECHGRPTIGGGGIVEQTRIVTANGTLSTARNVQSLFGVGLFERVSDEDIAARQDPLDENTDGISGRANIDGGRIGRFGRKAQVATVESIIRGMLENQMGLTSDSLESTTGALPRSKTGFWQGLWNELKSFSLATPAYAQARIPDDTGDSADGDNVEDPEIAPEVLESLLAYVMQLAPPVRGEVDAAVTNGEAVFERIGCSACHVPSMTLDDGTIIYPYSDLLLHDMGRDNTDFLIVGSATEQEYRTQPLWGVSLYENYLHNGSAQSIEDAILAHDGEADGSRIAYQLLTTEDRADLLDFLNSL